MDTMVLIALATLIVSLISMFIAIGNWRRATATTTTA